MKYISNILILFILLILFEVEGKKGKREHAKKNQKAANEDKKKEVEKKDDDKIEKDNSNKTGNDYWHYYDDHYHHHHHHYDDHYYHYDWSAPAGCYKDNTRYTGYNLQILGRYNYAEDPKTVMDCMNRCKYYRGCWFWTWDRYNYWCYLKSRRGYRRYNSQYESGSKYCMPPGDY